VNPLPPLSPPPTPRVVPVRAGGPDGPPARESGGNREFRDVARPGTSAAQPGMTEGVRPVDAATGAGQPHDLERPVPGPADGKAATGDPTVGQEVHVRLTMPPPPSWPGTDSHRPVAEPPRGGSQTTAPPAGLDRPGMESGTPDTGPAKGTAGDRSDLTAPTPMPETRDVAAPAPAPRSARPAAAGSHGSVSVTGPADGTAGHGAAPNAVVVPATRAAPPASTADGGQADSAGHPRTVTIVPAPLPAAAGPLPAHPAMVGWRGLPEAGPTVSGRPLQIRIGSLEVRSAPPPVPPAPARPARQALRGFDEYHELRDYRGWER
jgi:hypothetical protein